MVTIKKSVLFILHFISSPLYIISIIYLYSYQSNFVYYFLNIYTNIQISNYKTKFVCTLKKSTGKSKK